MAWTVRFAGDRPRAPVARAPSVPPPASTHALASPEWAGPLARLVEQEALVLSRPSRHGLTALGPAPPCPEVVCMGIGICTPSALSHGLPVDVLGMLLPAEMARRAVGASRLLVLVADEHAKTNRFSPADVEARARITVRTLARIRRRFGLDHMHVVRAGSFHRRRAFKALHAEIRQRAPSSAPEYVTRQVADLAYLTDQAGPALKVGWTIDGTTRAGARDEPAFDRLLEPWSGRKAAFIYCRAGRALDDTRRKVIPYVAAEPNKRVQLHPDEDVQMKLERAGARVQPEALKEMRNHLRRIVNSYGRVVEPVRGSLEARVQRIIGQLYRPPR